jgi:ubiquinol-cytochrome c reductase iron-sulfur subunit
MGAAVWPLINQMNPSADVRALASIQVDISGVAEGSQLTVKWLGKPVFIRHRTEEEIGYAKETPVPMICPTRSRATPTSTRAPMPKTPTAPSTPRKNGW